MKKFFESGVAFMVVAVLCLVAGVIAENGATFIGVGAFWMVMAIIVRSKRTRRPPKD